MRLEERKLDRNSQKKPVCCSEIQRKAKSKLSVGDFNLSLILTKLSFRLR
jgi:hypothetical protein